MSGTLIIIFFVLYIFRSFVYYAEVGTRYFFLSPLPLVRYLEIELPLRAGPLFLFLITTEAAESR